MVRHAELRDYENVKQLLVRTGLTTAEFFTKERFEKSLKKFGRYYLVEEKDGKIIGFISGFDDGPIFYGWMMRLAVDSAHRRQGMGERLARACLEEFRKAGATIVYVGAAKDNVASKALMKKLGFIDEGFELFHREF